jgi:3-hydroxyisobutyrate dehydrogenase-like beta-hydroxyacid dehydrogenase
MKIAHFGLGIIGSIWARNWAADGHQIRTWNRSPKSDSPGWTADPVEARNQGEKDFPAMIEGLKS